MEYQAIETTGATESKLRAYCDAVDLKAAVAFIKTHVIERRNSIPILDCVLIEGVGNSLRLTGTDLDLQASIDVAADIETPGRVAVAIDALATFLIKAAKASKGARVMIDQGERLRLSSGRGNLSLATQKPDDFPFIADTLSAEYEARAFTLSAEYADRLASLHQFCGKDEIHSNFRRAVNITASNGKMVMCATDGTNASIWRCDAPYGADGARLLIARKPVKSICAARDAFAKGAALSVQSTETRVIVEAGYCRIIAKLCEYDAPADMPAKLEAHIGNATPLIIPDIDPLISPKAIALFDKRAGKTGLLWEGGERAARITRPDAPEWTGYASNLKADRADKGNRDVTLQVGGHSIGVANDRGGLTLSVEAVAKLCGDDLFAVIPVTLPADVVPYQSDRRAYVTKWLYLAGATKFRTVPADGKVYGEKTAWLRHPMTRDQVDACLSADQRAALLAESQIVAPEPEIRLVPADIFKRDYAAAWAARDAAAMSEAIRAFRAYSVNAAARHLSADDVAAETQHSIRKICADIRGLGEKVKDARFRMNYNQYNRPCFERGIQQLEWQRDAILRDEANRRAKADWLASGALHPGDPRTIVQIEWTSGGVAQKGFAHVNALRDPDNVTIPICRKTGAVTKNKASIDTVIVLPGINATERKQVADAIAAYDAAINAPAPVDADVDTPIAEPETVVALSDELADYEAGRTAKSNGLPCELPQSIVDPDSTAASDWIKGWRDARFAEQKPYPAAIDAHLSSEIATNPLNRKFADWVYDENCHYSAGRGAKSNGSPRELPSYFVAGPNHFNARDWFRGWDEGTIGEVDPQSIVREDYIAPETPQDETATPLANDAEIAPQDEKNGLTDEIEAQPDPVAALIARMDALEAIILDQVRPGVGQVDHPSVEITNVVPLPIDPRALSVAKARQEIADDTPIGGKQRSPAHVRAIMAYLAMRKERGYRLELIGKLETAEKYQRELMSERDNFEGRLQTTETQSRIFYDQKREYYANWKRDELALQSMTAKRRRAVLKARDLQKRLYAQYKVVDRANDDRQKASLRANAAESELASLKQKLADPTNSARESDLLMLRDNAEKWQGKAEAAIAEGERLKQQVVHYGGQIENLAVRLARAEAMLRADPLQLTRIAA